MNEDLLILNTIYQKLLDREPDQSSIEKYMPILENDREAATVRIQEDIKQTTEYSTNIALMLRPDSTFHKQYLSLVESGLEFLKNQKIVFLGLARNLEHCIEGNINKLSRVGEIAKDYKIVIFENDSIDNTKIILEKLSNTNKNIHFLSETNNRPHFGTVKDISRTNALAEYRNKLKDYVVKHFASYDFVIVTDLDFIDFSPEGVYNSFGYLRRFGDQIDAIAGNSYEYRYVTSDTVKSLWNYDSWAFRYNWWSELPDLPSMTYNRMLWFGFFIMPVGSPVMSVNSSFGGMAIYKTEKFKLGIYDGTDCEHVRFHYSLKQNCPNFQLVLNPSQIMLL